MYRKKGLHLLACFFLALSLFFLFRTASALTDDEARTFAQQAREQALRAAHKQDMELASMYFVNALSFMPLIFPYRRRTDHADARVLTHAAGPYCGRT